MRKFGGGATRPLPRDGGAEELRGGPIDNVRRRYKKNSELACIGKRTREGCDRGNEDGQFTAGETGKGRSSEDTEGIWQKREL